MVKKFVSIGLESGVVEMINSLVEKFNLDEKNVYYTKSDVIKHVILFYQNRSNLED